MRASSPWKNGFGRRVRLSAAGVRFANGGRESLDRGPFLRGPLKSLGCRSQRDRRSRKSRGAVCGVAAPPRCAPASPSSRLLASDPAALATPPTPFFSSLLEVEPEEDHVAVLNDVILAFLADQALLLRRGHGTRGDQIGVGDRLRLDEASLEVGVDDPGGGGGGIAGMDRPGARLFFARREEGPQAEQVVRRADQVA